MHHTRSSSSWAGCIGAILIATTTLGPCHWKRIKNLPRRMASHHETALAGQCLGGLPRRCGTNQPHSGSASCLPAIYGLMYIQVNVCITSANDSSLILARRRFRRHTSSCHSVRRPIGSATGISAERADGRQIVASRTPGDQRKPGKIVLIRPYIRVGRMCVFRSRIDWDGSMSPTQDRPQHRRQRGQRRRPFSIHLSVNPGQPYP